jgi:hypothetical protein
MSRALTLLLVTLAIGAGPAATAPTRVRDGLVNGALRYLVPPEWEIVDRTADRMQVYYRDKPERATYSMMVTQQAQVIPLNDLRVRKQLSEMALAWANAELVKRKVEVLDAPKVEPDERFMLKIRERFKEGDAVWDVVHVYRGLGLNLVSATSATTNEEKNQIAAVHDAGAKLLLSATLGPQDPKLVRPVNVKPEDK